MDGREEARISFVGGKVRELLHNVTPVNPSTSGARAGYAPWRGTERNLPRVSDQSIDQTTKEID